MKNNLLNKVFERTLPKQALSQSQQIIIANVFAKKHNANHTSRLIALTDTHLLYFQDHTNRKLRRVCQLTFETRFEILRNEWMDVKNPGTPIGIRIDKEGRIPIQLYSDSPSTVMLWKQALQNKINQRGFHSLFKPIKKIGKGNFASVYLAQRLEDKKLVAVKAFSKESAFSQEKGRQSLINEIKLMRQMKHNNIMRLLGVYQSDNSIYMAIEYLEGGQLFNKIQNKHRFTPQETKKIMKGLLSGLEHMHSKRFMHRDLKPQNILLRHKEEFEVVIADFGLATWADEQEYLFVRCGTPGYVAPQIVNIKNLKTKSDPICDIFSVGLIFHILLMGKSIFSGKTYNQVLAQNRACDFDLNSCEYDILDPDTHNLLIRMLEKNPSARISASQCLLHPYFSERDNYIRSENAKRVEHDKENHSQLQRKHSLMSTTVDTLSKKRESLKEDSCVKFVQKYSVHPGSPKFEEYGIRKTQNTNSVMKLKRDQSDKVFRQVDINRLRS